MRVLKEEGEEEWTGVMSVLYALCAILGFGFWVKPAGTEFDAVSLGERGSIACMHGVWYFWAVQSQYLYMNGKFHAVGM